MKANWKVYAVVFSMVWIVAACVPATTEPAPTATEPAPRLDLAGSSWWVDTVGGEVTDMENAPTVEFTEGQVMGSAGCNSYSGTYTLQGDRISIVDVVHTEMFCTEPEGLMDVEGRFLEGLTRVERAFFDAEDRLLLLDGGGEAIITLTK